MNKEELRSKIQSSVDYKELENIAFSDGKYLALDICMKDNAVKSVSTYIDFVLDKVFSICDDEHKIEIELDKHLPTLYEKIKEIDSMKNKSKHAKDSMLELLFKSKYEALKRYSGLKDLF